MAIINNTVDSIGDVLTIKSQLSVRGAINLTGFTDVLIGETAERFFIKNFRYSKDNLTWSEWMILTDENVQKIQGSVFGLLFIECKYTRGGSTTTGILEFVSLELLGNIELQICNNTATVESIFADLVENDSFTSDLANNLLRKVYHHGILPTFIERGEETDNEDFVSLWGAVCFFMAMVTAFNNNFDEILYKRDYLIESIKQKGLQISGQETLLEDLQFLANNLKDEVRKRGTIRTTKEKGDEAVRGEWLRLLCKNYYDEFLIEVIEKKHMGYSIGNSSPLYNGTNFSTQINKTEENSEDFIDLAKYDTLGNVEIEGGSLKIHGDPDLNGLGFDLTSPPAEVDINRLITIDPEIDYEITFKVRRDAVLTGFGFRFGVLGFNRNGINKDLAFVDINTGASSNTFFNVTNAQEIAKVQGEWYSIRGIIYSNKSILLDANNSRLNINKGVNLKFNDEVEKVKVCIYGGSADPTQNIKIHDLKMRPLIRGRNILPDSKDGSVYVKNPQFIQQQNTVLSWMKNNGEEMTDDQVHNYIERYLLPYQQKLVSIFLSPKVDDKQLLT